MKTINVDELLKMPKSTIRRDPFVHTLADWNVPSVALIAKSLPGRVLLRTKEGYWLLFSNSRLPKPATLREAADQYREAGGEYPGPGAWFDDLLLAERGTARGGGSYRSTLYIPIDLFANLDEQIRDSRDYCREARKKLIAASGKQPRRHGRKRELHLSENILMFVLRYWKHTEIRSIAQRFYGSSDETARRLATRRIHSIKKRLLRHVEDLPSLLRKRPKEVS
jgi:hypothetical protein